MEKIKVLLVEDEQMLAMVVRETFEAQGFEITVASNGVEGWSLFHQFHPDVCILDIMMPRKDGLSLLTDIRLIDDRVAVILLTARIQTADVLKGLELGADDYMKKPFSMEELMLRVKNLVRRSGAAGSSGAQAVVQPGAPSGPEVIGHYRFNPIRLELIHDQQAFNLSQREADLLQLLVRYKNQLLQKRTALIRIWGEDNLFNSRSMDVYITRLRKYLVLDPRIEILNIRGKGYKLVD